MAPTLIRQAMHMIPMTGGRRRDPTGLMGLTTEMTEAGEEREAAREEISGTEVPLQQAAGAMRDKTLILLFLSVDQRSDQLCQEGIIGIQRGQCI